MTIITDSDRASKKRPFAEKMLRDIKMNELPEKTLTLNGFLNNVWQRDGLDGGFINSPVGAVVLCSHEGGTDLYMGESLSSGFLGPIPLNVVYRGLTGDIVGNVLLMNKPEDPVGVDTVPLRPTEQQSPRAIPNPSPPPDWIIDSTYYSDSWPYPCVDCLGGEMLWIGANCNMFIDLNDNDIPDFPKYILEIMSNFYISDGSIVNKRYSISMETGDGSTQPWRMLLALPTEQGKRLVHVQAFSYEPNGPDLFCAIIFILNRDTQAYGHMYAADVMDGIPSGILSILLNWDTPDGRQGFPLGNYAFSLSADTGTTLLHAVNLTNTVPHITPGPMESYFTANPGDEDWRLFYSIYDPDGTAYVVSSSQFLSLLDSLASGTIIGVSINWDLARRMLYQFFVWPGNNNWTAPFDSVMFHGEDLNVYVWTRAYGAVKFTRTGLFSATLYLPPEVTANDGVRAEITYAGDGLYTCVCNDLNDPASVLAIYYGAPFLGSSWTKLVDIDPEYKLVYARPEIVDLEIREFIGIAEKDDECFFCRYKEGWVIMAKIPVVFEEGMNWSASLFSKKQNRYLSPPPILAQMPVGPYNSYTAGLP